jgi:hypothetical protein
MPIHSWPLVLLPRRCVHDTIDTKVVVGKYPGAIGKKIYEVEGAQGGPGRGGH